MLDDKPRNDEESADALQVSRQTAGGMDVRRSAISVEGTDEIRTQVIGRASDKASETAGRGR